MFNIFKTHKKRKTLLIQCMCNYSIAININSVKVNVNRSVDIIEQIQRIGYIV
ncbi:hypothetical protein [Natranaerovirga pectinivora]|uniref:hypothetical protein n=1 Tax=Natranaerovirga pectinivora TaxID=682400 RepID=UPI001404D3F5|nr:hypothetical protein [Natranaerovirga pectinivora]